MRPMLRLAAACCGFHRVLKTLWHAPYQSQPFPHAGRCHFARVSQRGKVTLSATPAVHGGGDQDRLDGSRRPLGVKRIRQHLNPLSELASRPVELAADWFESAFGNPNLPLTIDIGSALGGWISESAAAEPTRNFLGLEIRPAAVEVAIARLQASPKDNVCFVKANANVDLERIITDARRHAQIDRILIQFPDPHFKKRHWKRRIVNDDLATIIADALAPTDSGFVYISSDVLELAEHMRSVFHAHPSLEQDSTDLDDQGWRMSNPLAFPTERERCVLKYQGKTSTEPGRVFRAVFTARH